LNIFNTFAQLFNQNNPSYEKEPRLVFNLKTLEFLHLFAMNRLPPEMQPRVSNQQIKEFQREAHLNMNNRRNWLLGRQRETAKISRLPASKEEGMLRDTERQILKAWSQPKSSFYPVVQQDVPMLFDLLPRFMWLTAEIADLMGDPNEDWIDIACHFMLQAALEALSTYLTTTDDLDPFLPVLEECFAWGHVDADFLELQDVDDDAQRELLINDMFRDKQPTPTPTAEASISRECTIWTQSRAETLSEFQIPVDASGQSQSCRVERLAIKYPIEEFQISLVRFLEGVWTIVCEEINDKPILVQIEEGHLESHGIKDQEFDDFMLKVGLKKTGSKLLKLKL
jgi:hypothetical protein